MAATVDLNDIDLGQLADTSTEMSTSPTSNSDADPGLPRQDYLDFWKCAQCKVSTETGCENSIPTLEKHDLSTSQLKVLET